jgi:hypothetical protein
MNMSGVILTTDVIADFCRRHCIRRLAVFGSVLREDFTATSDLDVLVEFEPGHSVGFLTFAGMENELTDMVGRKVHLSTPGQLSQYFRDEVLQEAETVYVAA